MEFVCRKNHTSDGEWTNYIDDEMMNFEKLSEIYNHACDGGIVNIKNGKDDAFRKNIDFTVEFIGLLIREALNEMRSEGSFSQLNALDSATIEIEEFNGEFADAFSLY